MNALNQIETCGPSPCPDYLEYGLIKTGGLHMLIDGDGLKGLSPFPPIFGNAIGERVDCADAQRQLLSSANDSVPEINAFLAVTNIPAAAGISVVPHGVFWRREV